MRLVKHDFPFGSTRKEKIKGELNIAFHFLKPGSGPRLKREWSHALPWDAQRKDKL